MRRLPKSLRLLSARITVEKVQGLHHSADESKCYGIYEQDELTIYIDPGYTLERQKVSFLHESLHAMIGVSNMAAAESEEEAVNRLAPLLLDFLRSNKAAVAFLQES